MGLFDKLRDKKDKNDNVEKELDSTEVKEDVVADAGIDEDELSLDFGSDNDTEDAEVEKSDVDSVDDVDSADSAERKKDNDFYDGNLQEEIVDAIGKGSEDVKNFVAYTKDGNEIKFVVSGGVIKQVTSDEGLNVPARLAWTDSDKFEQSELDTACEIFENYDYFDALTNLILDENISKDEEGAHGQELAAIISEAHKEESIRTLIRFADAQVDKIEVDWSVDSDADTIEAYGGFSLDPVDVDAVVESFNFEVESKLDRIGAENLIYPTTNTDYIAAESDEERYVIAAVFSEYEQRASDEPGAAGTEVSTLIQYAHGFSVVGILDTVLDLLEKEFLSYDDPLAEEEEVEEEEYVEEIEPFVEEVEEPEAELEDEVEDEYAEYMQDIAEDNFKPYPAAIEGGTENLGGALTHYINELRSQGVFTNSADSEVEYNISYNTLYEESVQSVEFSLRHVVNSLEASKRVYGGFESIGGQSTDKVSKNSNLYRAAYLVETERNDLNKSRVPILKDLKELLLDVSEYPSEIVQLAIVEIDNKLQSIEEVSDVVMGEGAAQFIVLDENYTPENTPLYYQVARELGVQVA